MRNLHPDVPDRLHQLFSVPCADFLLLCVTDDEGSGSDVGKKFTKCSTCKYGAECDEDSEDVWWVFWNSQRLY